MINRENVVESYETHFFIMVNHLKPSSTGASSARYFTVKKSCVYEGNDKKLNAETDVRTYAIFAFKIPNVTQENSNETYAIAGERFGRGRKLHTIF